MLPENSAQLIFADVEALTQRRAFNEILEGTLRSFVRSNEKAPNEELLRASSIDAVVVGFDREWGWSCILQGDFRLTLDALRRASGESGKSPYTELVEIRGDVEIYGVFADRSHGPRDELYLALPDLETLALTEDLHRMREMVDRRQGGLSLPHALAVMLEDWGLPDYLHVFDVENYRDNSDRSSPMSHPAEFMKFYGVHVTLADDLTTTIRMLQQFDNEQRASAAAAWLQAQTEPHYRTIRYGKTVMHSQWTQRGPTVYAHITVPDEDSLDLIGDITWGN